MVTPGDGRQRKAGAEPDHRVERMVRQDAGEREPPERRRDGFERGEKARREYARPCHDFPERPDDEKREGVAPDQPPARLGLPGRFERDGVRHAAIMQRTCGGSGATSGKVGRHFRA